MLVADRACSLKRVEQNTDHVAVNINALEMANLNLSCDKDRPRTALPRPGHNQSSALPVSHRSFSHTEAGSVEAPLPRNYRQESVVSPDVPMTVIETIGYWGLLAYYSRPSCRTVLYTIAGVTAALSVLGAIGGTIYGIYYGFSTGKLQVGGGPAYD